MLVSNAVASCINRRIVNLRVFSTSSTRCEQVKTPVQQFGWEYLQRQRSLGRPISPHLTVYKPQLTWMVSGAHRIAGCVMAGTLLVGGVGFAILPIDFTTFVDFIRGLNLPIAVTAVFKFIIAFPIIFHTLNGIRFIGFDLAKGVDNVGQIYKGGYLVLALSTIIALAVVANSYLSKRDAKLMPELLTNYDFEEERLDIKNFVIYYFEYRIKLDGGEWYESPGLIDDPLEEHIMMGKLASIFEQKRKAEIAKMVEEILEDSSLAFPRFCDVLDEFDREGNDNTKRMSYARLVGIIAFSGCLAAALIRNNQRREVQQILLYTSTFLGTRIRLTWSLDDRSWAQFMTFSRDLIRRDEKKKAETRRQSRRSFKIMVGVGIGVAVLGSVVGAKLLR